MKKKYKLIVFVAIILIFSVFTSVLPRFSNKIPAVVHPKASATDYAIIRPDGDVYSGGWSKEGFTYYYENVDDNVIQPTDGDDGGYEVYTNLNLKSIKFSLQNHAGIVKSYTVWVRTRTTDTVGSLDTFIDYKFGAGDTYIGQIGVYSSQGEIWDSIQVNNVDEECINWDLRFRSVAVYPKFIWIDVVYVEIEYYIDSPPSPITITSPEDTTYTSPMQGYYPATYGFENESEGSLPNHWVKSTPGYGADAYIINEVNNRKKCLKLHDPSAWIWYPFIPFYTYVQVANSFENQNLGSIEFWLLMPFHWTRTYIYLKDYSTGVDVITLRLKSSTQYGLEYFSNGQWYVVLGFSTTIIAGYWYQFKIDFDLNNDFWKFTMTNGVAEDTTQKLPLTYNSDVINGIVFSTEDVGVDYDIYLDAIGYSWDPYYDVGDNKYEGLFLEFTPSDLDEMTLTFNDQERRIYGDMVLPMPKSGEYSMRISGYDDPIEYLSDIRYFTVDYSEKIFITFYASDLPQAFHKAMGANSESFENSHGLYGNALYARGYRKFYYFRDVDDITKSQTCLYTFDGILELFANKRIDVNDEVFIFIVGHGPSYFRGESETFLNGYDHEIILTSTHLAVHINLFVQTTQCNATQCNKVGIIIESCRAGDYVPKFELFDVAAYLVTSTDIDHPSWYIYDGIRWYGMFSECYWMAVADGNYNSRGAFTYAKYHAPRVTDQNPQEYYQDGYYLFFT